MLRPSRYLLLFVFPLVVSGPMSDPISAQDKPVQFAIAEVFPGFSGQLRTWNRVSVRLTYRSDRPVRFRIAGYAGGQKVGGGSSNIAPPYPAGEGEALVWFAHNKPATIDEIRIDALDERWRPLASISAPAQLEWSPTAVGNRRPNPEW